MGEIRKIGFRRPLRERKELGGGSWLGGVDQEKPCLWLNEDSFMSSHIYWNVAQLVSEFSGLLFYVVCLYVLN